MSKTTTATPAYKIANCDDCCTGTCINICEAKQNGSYTFYTVCSAANLAVNANYTNCCVFVTREQIKECRGYRPKIYENKIIWNIPAQTTTVDYNYYYNNYTTITGCSENPYKIAAPNLLYTEDKDCNKTYYTYAGYYDGTNIYNTFSTTEPSTDAKCYILLEQPDIKCETCNDTTTYSINPNIINNSEASITPTTHAIKYSDDFFNNQTTNLNAATDYLIYYSIPVCANNTNNCSITINSPINKIYIVNNSDIKTTSFIL